jgi:peptide/nickel transport system substrate-binding protein
MRLSARARFIRILATAGLTAAVILPAASSVQAADPVVLRVGTTQDLDSLNPYNTLLVVGYEVFGLTYNYLVDSGPNLEPVPGYADKWERAADGKSWTFHIRDGMKWSDGQPATSADACFSWQLGLDAIAANGGESGFLGAGYLDPTLKDAGVTKVDCTDPANMVVSTDDPSDRVLQVAMPIIPKHVWGKFDYKTIADQKFDGPLVGTGPYTVKEWQTGQFIQLVRNPNYWGTQAYQDEVSIVIYKGSPDTMVQALKAGELDYAHGPNGDQLNQLKTDPNIAVVAGKANGWSQLAFNGYGADTGKTIPNGGPSTKALLDPAFRDALGYAIDKDLLVERVLGGYGEVGTTIVPPVLDKWHVEPTTKRTFDIEKAKSLLDAAGYKLDASGKRLDKEGKPITLRIAFPNSDTNYPKAVAFIKDWYGQLGVGVSQEQLDSAVLGEKILPPEAGDGYVADYDIELWGWSGAIDPNGLLQIFECSAIGSSSDSQYCNPAYDQMYEDQLKAPTAEARKAILAQMQNLIYDKAVYDILYYDANLEAYRTDRFAGWTNQPVDSGEPFFTYSTLQYTKLIDAKSVPTPAPSQAAASGSPAASGAPSAAATPAPSGSGSGDSAGSTTPILIGVVVAVIAIVAGVALASRRRSAAGAKPDDDDDE